MAEGTLRGKKSKRHQEHVENAAAWRKRLAIGDGPAAEAFDAAFMNLPDDARDAAPPPKDGGRCPHCRKKIELDTHYKAMCNGFCDTAKRGSKSGCVSKVVALWKSLTTEEERAKALGAAPASGPSSSRESSSGIVGLSSSPSVCAPVAEAAPAKPRCLRTFDSGERCSGDALPTTSYCSRRCEGSEAARVARLAKMVADEAAADEKPAPDEKPAKAAAPRRPKASASLGSMLAGLKKEPPKPKAEPKPEPPRPASPPPVPRAPAPAAPPPPRQHRQAPVAPPPHRQAPVAPPQRQAPIARPPPRQTPLAELEAFVVGVIGEKYWPNFVDEEIDDIGTLRLLTVSDFADMQIPLGPRLKLMKALEAR